MTEVWQAEQKAFAKRDLSGVDYVYMWPMVSMSTCALRRGSCLLVLIGVRADGRKELVALTDGYREATESWADLLRDAKRRGMRAPVLGIGDGALGFWAAHARRYRTPANKGAGFTRLRMFLPRYRNRRIRGPRRRLRRSGTPKTRLMPWIR